MTPQDYEVLSILGLFGAVVGLLILLYKRNTKPTPIRPNQRMTVDWLKIKRVPRH